MLYREIIAVCSEIHTKDINTLCGQNVVFKDPVRTALLTLTTSVIKTSLLMFYKAKVAVCSEIHTKHINAMWAPRRIF
jgi:hypothetical protein